MGLRSPPEDSAALLHADDHPLAVDVGYLGRDHLRGAQAGAVGYPPGSKRNVELIIAEALSWMVVQDLLTAFTATRTL